MEIKIHRGENQIGGNIVEIFTENTRILLDVGLALDEAKNAVLPEVDGLFDRKGIDAVFISHYHSDHMGLAYRIHPDIPIFLGEMSSRIVKASDQYRGVKSIVPAGFLKHRVSVTVGDITVTPFLCDHSAFDSYMLLCEADGQRVLYTGDFRANGRKPYTALLSALPHDVDTLICEGTTLTREGYVPQTETELENDAVRLFQAYTGPVFVLQSSTNIDRIVTMYRAAKRSNRVFLEDVYMAGITSSVGGSIPNPQFSDVYPFITNPADHDKLDRFTKRVGKNFISQHDFVMCVRTSMLRYMKSLARQMNFENGLLVYSFWSGYKETDSVKAFLHDCRELGLTVVTLHTSGHADQDAIKKLIATVNPRKILPIHTEAAEWFEGKTRRERTQ